MGIESEGAAVLNGGLITGMPAHAIGASESPDCENVDPSYPLGARTRRGSSAYAVTLPAAGSGNFMGGLKSWTRDNGTAFVAFANATSIYIADGASALLVKTGMATDSIMQAAALDNKLVIVASGLYPQISSAGSSLSSVTSGTYITTLAKYATEYAGKVIISGDPANPSRIAGCKSGNPEDWSTANNAFNADIGTGDGDVIKGVSGTRRALFIFKRANTYVMTGNSTANYQVDQLCAWGLVSERAVATDGQGTFFASDDGIYYAVGTNCGRISDPVKATYDAISDKSGLTMAVKGDKLFIFYPSTGSTNSRALVCAFKRKMSDGGVRGVWSTYSAQPYNVADTSRVGDLYAGTNASTLQIYALDTGSPGAVTAYWRTPDFDFNGYDPKTVVRYFVHMAGDTGTTTLTNRFYRDGASTSSDGVMTFGTTTSQAVEQVCGPGAWTGRFIGMRMTWTGDKTLYGVRIYADVRSDGIPRR